MNASFPVMIGRASLLLTMSALTSGCPREPSHNPPAGFPDDYAQNHHVRVCGNQLRTVSGVRGELWREVEHGQAELRVWTASPGGEEPEHVGVEIAAGERMRPLALAHLRVPAVGMTADVTFDGWVLKDHDCPATDRDIYFVDRFTKINPRPDG